VVSKFRVKKTAKSATKGGKNKCTGGKSNLAIVGRGEFRPRRTLGQSSLDSKAGGEKTANRRREEAEGRPHSRVGKDGGKAIGASLTEQMQ